MNNIGGSNKVFSLFQSLFVKRKLDISSEKLKVFTKALMLPNLCYVVPSCCPNSCCVAPPGCFKFLLSNSLTSLLSLLLLPISHYGP